LPWSAPPKLSANGREKRNDPSPQHPFDNLWEDHEHRQQNAPSSCAHCSQGACSKGAKRIGARLPLPHPRLPPARLLHDHNDLRHERLPADETWTGYGNLFLLDKPELYALQVSRRIVPEALETLQAEILERVRNGGVLVSPFISPGEKDIARAALDAGGTVILMKPDGFPPCFKPHGKYFDLCVQGRLLILACRPPAAGNTPVTRDLCLAMNRWCQHIAEAPRLPPAEQATPPRPAPLVHKVP